MTIQDPPEHSCGGGRLIAPLSHKCRRMKRRTLFWPAFLPLILLSGVLVNWVFLAQSAFALTASKPYSAPGHNTFQQFLAEGRKDKVPHGAYVFPKPKTPLKPGGMKAPKPGAEPPTMQPLSVTLSANDLSSQAATLGAKPFDLKSSDGRLEIKIPAGAFDLTHATTATGASFTLSANATVTLRITETAGYVPGELPALGTYQLQVLDTHGNVLQHIALRMPITYIYHYKQADLAELNVDPNHVYLMWSQLASKAQAAKQSTSSLIVPFTNNAKALTLTAQSQVVDTAGPLVAVGSSSQQAPPVPLQAAVQGNSGTFGLTYPLQIAPSPFAPTVQLTYSTADPNGRYDSRASADHAGDGWQISLGAITATVENGTTWYFINGVDNISDRLIPDPQNSGFYLTEHISHLRIQKVSNSFWVWDTSGNAYIFGSTSDSSQYTTSGSTQTYYRYDLHEEKLANEGRGTAQRQIRISYLQDISNSNVRDSAIEQIQYGIESADGTTFTVQGTVDFSYLAPFSSTGSNGVVFATKYTTSTSACTSGTPPVTPTMRCDDPMTYNGSVAPPTVMSTMQLQSITTYVGDDSSASHTDYQYTFSYTNTPISTCVDPYSQTTLYCAGEHLLTSITPIAYLGGTGHPQPAVSFQYITERNTYYDSGNKTANGAQQYYGINNWSYLSAYYDANTGIGEQITYGTAYNNTHGTPTLANGDNQLDPLFCYIQSAQCSGSYAHPDDKAWSQQVVTQRQDFGTDTGNNQVHVAVTTSHYQLSQTCGGNCVGDNWIPSGDNNWLNYYYDSVFKGFAEVDTISPAGELTADHYYGTEGWGTPATDLINYASGSLTEEDIYSGSSNTSSLLQQTINSYGGASGSNTATSCDTVVTGTYIPCETVLLSTQKTLVDGNGTPTTDTSSIDLYTYDDYNPSASGTGLETGTGHYHNMLQDQLQERVGSYNCSIQGCPQGYSWATVQTEKWQYATNDQTVNNWTYYVVNTVKESEIDDASGHIWQCTTTAYDEGAASGIPTPAQGLPTTVSTYSSANCASQTSPLTTTYTGYEGSGNVVETVDAVGAANSSLYGSQGCTLTTAPAIKSSSWTASRYTNCTTYDALNAQPLQTTNALGQTSTTSYDTTQQDLPVSVTDPNNQPTTTAYSYDSSGQMITQVSLPQKSGSYTTQSTSHSTCASGIPASAQLPTQPCYEEDSNSSLYSSAVSRTFYDSEGRKVETRTPGPTPGDDTVVMTVYNDQTHTVWTSEPFQVADGAGWIDPNTAKDINGTAPAGTMTFYDALDRVIATQDFNYWLGHSSGISCSATLSGTYTSCVNYSGGFTGDEEPAYPVVLPAGTVLNSPREKVTNVDPNGHVTVTYSDAIGRTLYTDVYGGVYGGTLTLEKQAYFKYQALDKPTSVAVSDAAAQSGQSVTSVTTTMTYDDLDRLLTVNDPEQGTLTYSYDPNGKIFSVVQTSGSNSRTLGYNYDLLERITCEQTAAPTINATGACSAGSPLVQNTYDTTVLGTKGSTDFPIGQLTQSVATTYYPDGTSATVTEQFQHDQRGRLITQQVQVGVPSGWGITSALPSYQETMLYNDADQVTTTSTNAGGSGGYTFTQVYDSGNGTLQGVSNNGGSTANLATLSYNEYAQLGSITQLNGAASSPTSVASEIFNYDGNQRPTSLTASWLPGSGNSGQILSQGRTYDNASNVTSVNTTFAAVPGQTGSGGSETQNFCYDEQNRLIWSGNAGTQPGAGNGTCGSGTLGNTLSGANYTAPYTYTNLGQIWQGPTNGQGAAVQYLYCNSSAPHQLTGIYPAGTTCANKGSYTATYSAGYDPWGNMTSRTYNGVTATLSYDALNHLTEYNAGSSGQEFYVYDASGNRILKRSISGGSTTLATYVFGLEEYHYSGTGVLSSQLHYYTLAGHLVGAFDGTNTTFYLTDALGSVLLSFSQNAILGEQIYGPYGASRYMMGNINTAKGYTGQFHDAVSGLDYYNARYYDPVVGRFLSVDSVQGNMLGFDPYAYVGGNPETLCDPTGHWGWGDVLAVGVGVVALGNPLAIIGGGIRLGFAAINQAVTGQSYDPMHEYTVGAMYGDLAIPAAAFGLVAVGCAIATAGACSVLGWGAASVGAGFASSVAGNDLSSYVDGWATRFDSWVGNGSNSLGLPEVPGKVGNGIKGLWNDFWNDLFSDTPTAYAAAVQQPMPLTAARQHQQEVMGKANRALMGKLAKKQEDVRKNTITRFHLGNRGVNGWGSAALHYYTYHNFLAEYSVMGDSSAPILNGKNRFL